MVRAGSAASVAVGAALLAWPALLNGYPLMFSDTGAFLHQTLGPLMIWDKPWVYGPVLHAFHWRLTLWLPLAAQALMTAWLLALAVRAVRGRAEPWTLLALCALAALATTAPFTVALLMPDVFTPAVVLALFLLGCAHATLSRAEALVVGLIATVGTASHLSHLPLAAALVAATLLLTRRLRPALRCAVPLAGAIGLLLATNAVGHGRTSLSPHGATFLLARLQADGPAAATIRARCPATGWYLCAFADRLPMDANDFLWIPESPVNRDPEGRPRAFGGALLSPEAREIVAATVRDAPFAVAGAMALNTLRQIALVRAGDTLGNDHLVAAVRPRIAEGFPPRELAAYEAGLQARGLLRDRLAPVLGVAAPVLLVALALAPFALWRSWGQGAGALLALVLVGALANAFASGALSGPVPRYEARIAWLLPVAVLLAFLPIRRRAA
jgi:hypothetical protein